MVIHTKVEVSLEQPGGVIWQVVEMLDGARLEGKSELEIKMPEFWKG